MDHHATTIDRLATLSSQRTARTDRLHESARALLAKLSPLCEVGDRVTIDGYELARCRAKSNIGEDIYWSFGNDETACDIERPVGKEGYVHGDFATPWRGPSRAELIAFGARAGRFVEALSRRFQAQIDALKSAEAEANAATEKLATMTGGEA